MNLEVCREYLDKLLMEESAALQRLETLLDREHASLQANDFAAFEATGQAREACVGELVCLDAERQSLCRAMNISSDRQGVERLMKECDRSGALLATWTKCMEHAARCRSLNERNGGLVNIRLNQVQSLLDVVTDRTVRPKTYGRQGVFQTQDAATRVRASV